MTKRTLVFTFGRYNPPTKGHIHHFQKLIELAQPHDIAYPTDACVFVSPTCDNVRNPVTVEERTAYIRKAMPDLIVGVAQDMFRVIEQIAEKGRYTRVRYVVGRDYFFDPAGVSMIGRLGRFADDRNLAFDAMCSGDRVPGISGTELREAAMDQNFERFAAASPIGVGDLTEQDARHMFELVQRGLK